MSIGPAREFRGVGRASIRCGTNGFQTGTHAHEFVVKKFYSEASKKRAGSFIGSEIRIEPERLRLPWDTTPLERDPNEGDHHETQNAALGTHGTSAEPLRAVQVELSSVRATTVPLSGTE